MPSEASVGSFRFHWLGPFGLQFMETKALDESAIRDSTLEMPLMDHWVPS